MSAAPHDGLSHDRLPRRGPTFVSGKLGQFRYFDRQLRFPRWPGARVLDFGGNAGNLLADPCCTIVRHKYTSIDVSRDAVRYGRQRFPRANFVFYDRYNPCFNPTGNPGEPLPDLGLFDLILAYSVFTHILPDEMVALVTSLRQMLTEVGRLAFTFIDPHWLPAGQSIDNLSWRLDRPVPPTTSAALYVVADGELYLEEHEATPGLSQFDTLYPPATIRRLFPSAELRDPLPPERQHCAILHR